MYMTIQQILREKNLSRYQLSKKSGVPWATLADIAVRILFSLTSGMMAGLTCYEKGASTGQSLLCGFATSLASFITSMLSVWIPEDNVAAIMTELSFGLGLNISASALGMTENTSSKNNTQRNDSKQNVVKRRSKQSPPRLPYHKLFTYRPEFV